MSIPKILYFLIKESYYGISYPITSLFLSPKIYRNNHPKGTIILGTCWFTKNRHHNKWASYFEKKGYRTYVVNLPFTHEDFPTTAERLEKFITEHNVTDYTLVGISTAALVCVYFLHHYNRWKDVHKFISLGGPLHGTTPAWFISFTKKGRDMRSGSSFIKEIEKIPIPKNKMVAVSADGDELVPKEENRLQGVPTYIVPVWGHNNLHISTQKTYDLILKIASSKD